MFASVAIGVTCRTNSASAGDWTTWRSTYTHDPYTGQRVDQYAPVQNPPAPDTSEVSRSGYRNYRSTLQGAFSADNMHIVSEWGKPVLPYEQWRFPFRPYAVPYGAWGPQPPLVQGGGSIGFPGGGWLGGYPGFPGQGFPGQGFPGQVGPQPQPLPGNGPFPPVMPGYPGVPGAYPGYPLTPANSNQPWFDGSYPAAPPLDNRTDAQFFYRPPAQ